MHPSQMACDVIANSLQCESNRCTEQVFVGAMMPSPPCARLEPLEVADAWRQFDPLHRGELPESEVLSILTEFGEPLSIKEAQAALHLGEFRGRHPGTIDYMKFTEFIMSKRITGWN